MLGTSLIWDFAGKPTNFGQPGIRPLAALGVRLRPFPFPYRAALAICSDIDGCDRPSFLAVHRYLNDPTQGLGLPVADSFFGRGREPGQMAYFLPDGRTPGPDANLIVQALRGGLIDSLHAWGDFNLVAPDPEALRAMAARLTEDLVRQGVSVKIWINHGDPCNRQNLQARLQPVYGGDDPASPYYTADLLKDLGLKYYWWSELVSWPLSCGRLRVFPDSWLRPGLNALKNAVKILLGQRHKVKTTAQIMELCQAVTLRDGLPVMAFTRHIRKEPTSRHTLRHTLGPPVLEALLAQEGYLILYTHLGLPRPQPGEELFPPPERAALASLAEHYHAGRIWVAPTIRVLNHWLVTRHLAWTVSREGERLIIHLEKLQDPTTGPRPPELEELAGLCFYVPPGVEVILRLEDRQLVPRVFGADHTGEMVVGLDPPPPPDLAVLA
ncbi:MAG: hypothetical protein HY790_13600 [Deltaproteobacteria bacterium]|nr:hypothetical protein [Deltaproteobacteria bacterium]MBI4796847.1 hypothetical protein [Deltaproteobacteria bacterium]